MAQESLITEEMQKAIGQIVSSQVVEVTRSMIAKYLEAVGESNPLYWDEEYARRSEYGGVVAPPGLLLTIQMHGGSPRAHLPFKRPLERGVNAGSEWEFYRVVRPGDFIFSVVKLANLIERQGKKFGTMLFYVYEITFINQRGELVAKELHTSASY